MSGFASRRSRKDSFSFWFRRVSDETLTSETNIKNIGVETHFYGDQDDPALDQRITDEEGPYAKALDEARSGQPLNQIAIAEFAGNLRFRTRALRDGMLALATGVYEAGQEIVTEKSHRLLTDILFRTAFDRAAQKQGLRSYEDLPDEIKARLLEGFVPELDKFDKVAEGYAPFMDEIIASTCKEMLSELSYDAVRRAHIGVMSANDRGQVSKIMTRLKWSSLQFASGSLILGDTGAIMFDRGLATPDNPLDPNASGTVWIPISHDRILVGSTDDFEFRNVSVADINEAAASLSVRFFISAKDTPLERNLATIIGTKAAQTWDVGVKAGRDAILRRLAPWRLGTQS